MKKSVFRLYRNKTFSAILSVCMIAVTVLTGAAPLTEAETVLDNLAIGAAAFCDVTHKDFPAAGLTDGNTTFDNGHTMIVQNTASFSIILDLGQMTLSLIHI